MTYSIVKDNNIFLIFRMNMMCIFLVAYLAQSAVIQALQCYNGSDVVAIPWFVSSQKEREEFEVRQRADMEKDFPLIECDSEFTQCYKVVPDCGIADAYMLVKGCALPEGNSTCVSGKGISANQWCREWNMKRSKCEMCSSGNGCNKEEWQNGIISTVPASTTTSTNDISISTTDENDIVTVTDNGLSSWPLFFW